MISDLNISYVMEGVRVNLSVEDDHYDNLPYNVGEMLVKLIEDANLNPEIIHQILKNRFVELETNPPTEAWCDSKYYKICIYQLTYRKFYRTQ